MIRIRDLAKDSVIYGFTSAARSLVGVFLVPIYSRFFLPAEYGTIDTLTTAVAFLTLILTLGMDTAVALFFYSTKDDVDRGAMLTTALLTRILLSTSVACLISWIAPAISWSLFGTNQLAMIVTLATWTAPVNALVGFLLELLRLGRRAIPYSILAVTNLLLGVLFSILFVVWLRWGIFGAFAGPLLASLVVLPVIVFITHDLLSRDYSIKWLVDLLKVGMPMIPAAFGGWLIAYANRYFLLYYASSADVGLLAVGVKASAPVTLLTSTFLTAWGPFAFSLQQQENAGVVVAKVFTNFLIVGATLAVTIGIFTRELLILFTTPQYYAGHIAGGLMIFQLLADAAYYIVALGLLYTKQTKLLAFSTPIVAATNLLLNWILVPRYGFVGAAITGFLSYAFSATLVYVLAQRTYPIPYERNKVLRLIVLSLGSWLIGISFVSDAVWTMVVFKLLVIVGFLASLFLLGIVTRSEVDLLSQGIKNQWRNLQQRALSGST